MRLEELAEDAIVVTAAGGFPYPPAPVVTTSLPAQRRRLAAGLAGEDAVARATRDALRAVLLAQAAAGIDLGDDGMLGRRDALAPVSEYLYGVRPGALVRFFDTNTYIRRPLAAELPRREGSLALGDYQRAAAEEVLPVKAVLPGPLMCERWLDPRSAVEGGALTLAVATALNQEARDLVAAGAPLVQFDEPAAYVNSLPLEQAAAVWETLLQGLGGRTAVRFCFAAASRAAVATAVEAGFAFVGLDLTAPGAAAGLEGGAPPGLMAGVIDARSTRPEPVANVRERIRLALSLNRGAPLLVAPNHGLHLLPWQAALARLACLRLAVDGL